MVQGVNPISSFFFSSFLVSFLSLFLVGKQRRPELALKDGSGGGGRVEVG